MSRKLTFYNDVVNKRKLQDLMYQAFHSYGVVKSSLIADKVKNLTFHYATRSGISLNAEDLRVPYRKRQLIGLTNNEVETTEQKYNSGTITSVERFQKVIDIWNNASNTLKDDVLTYFRESDPLNPLYIMAFSGARGNISQVRQLVGMRGLMADPQGQIIDLPIKSNFREGLKVTEYVISSYGARKGLVDTALRTADSGYLTRRLVDVAQDIIIRDEDCLTSDSLSYNDLFERYETTLSFNDRLVGRLLAEPFFSSDKEQLIAPRNAEITLLVANKLQTENINDIKVRSPLTCNSNRSVCRKCYGWHLAYSKLVDLGEAVGIVAAQSIGEPGTQLTMRTFHTGGVFSGDLTRQIRAPFAGTISYKLHAKTTLVRTMHGEQGFRLHEKATLYLQNGSGTRTSLVIPEENILLVNHNQKVYESQILAEIKKDANLILEEDSKNVYTQVSGETFFQNIAVENVLDKQGALNTISKTTGLIWVLNGERYRLPKASTLNLKIGQKLRDQDVIAQQTIRNNYPGIVKFDSSPIGKSLKVLNFSLLLKNTEVIKINEKETILKVFHGNVEKKFQLKVKNNDVLKNGQTLAVLKEDSYKTQTGGIICYDITANQQTQQKKITKKVFSGSLYWIPEETFTLKSSLLDTLLVKDGNTIAPGSEIWPGTFSKLGGLVEIDRVAQEIIIRSGEVFRIADTSTKKRYEKGRFVQPGEYITPTLLAQRLSYIQIIEAREIPHLIIRPVSHFKVPREKGFLLEHLFFPERVEQRIKLKTVKRIFYKNWERVRSHVGVDLLQTFLVLNINEKYTTLHPQLETIQVDETKSHKRLKISLYEVFKTTENEKQNINTNYLVTENQFIHGKTIVARRQIVSTISGTLINKGNEQLQNNQLLILKEKDIKTISWSAKTESLLIKVGDLIRIGSPITKTRNSLYSGQVYNITSNTIFIRPGRPYLISEGTILRVPDGAIVQQSDILATLIYEKLKTVDIVQGLPKVEEILEARKVRNSCLIAPCSGHIVLRSSGLDIMGEDGNKIALNIDPKVKIKYLNGDFVNVGMQLTDGQISPHEMLAILFEYFRWKLTIDEACKVSFKYLQLFLVNEVQRTYLAQGVQIADKHIEVIVKQMTSKVRVEESGDTTLLPGEILNLYNANIITKTAMSMNDSPPFYIPILLGLTKASLNSDSFISAASFQETTRVLTEAAIEGKKDWLNGLKENVIIGRLIPAGTGFNCYEHFRKIRNENAMENNISTHGKLSIIKTNILSSRLNELE